MTKNKQQIISIAPMMDWTDRHCRYFHRLIAPNLTLYTEMVTTGALLFGEKERFLRFDKTEHPIVLQLGGSNPQDLAISAKMGEDAGYDEINLNCGCPSDRVQSGSFGAYLMKEPQLVGKCVKAMQDSISLPITIKCRIGIDDSEDYVFLQNFVRIVSDAGCQTFIIHARKAWLKGLSPKENREIPPLQYDIVERLKADFPHLNIQLNGGIKTLEQINSILNEKIPPPIDTPLNGQGDSFLNGAMIGREAYQNPWFLHKIEKEFYNTQHLLTAEDVVMAMIPYIERQQKDYETPVKSITRHMTGLFQGKPGARIWRQILSTEVHKDGVTAEILKTALNKAFKA